MVTFLTAGGGGFGDPLRRDEEAVLRDVRLGFVSEAAAARDYGVVVRDGAIDPGATARLRNAPRAAASERDFDFGPERPLWESVFDDAAMNRLNVELLALPASMRTAARRRVFAEVTPRLPEIAAIGMAAVIDDPPAQRARLATAIDRLAAVRSRQAAE